MSMTFEEWRASIPFTDEQILSAFAEAAREYGANSVKAGNRFEGFAASLREGRLSSVALRSVLPYLVKVCHVCGKKALYRHGVLGACSAHRDTLRKVAMRDVSFFDRRAAAWEAMDKEYQTTISESARHHKARGGRKTRRP